MPLFQVDLDTTYPIYNQSGGTTPKSVRELLALAESQNLGDSIIIKRHYHTDNEWYAVPFYKKATETNVYYGTTNYLNYSGYQYNAGIGRNIFSSTTTRYTQYILNQNGQLIGSGSFEFNTKEVDSVFYFILGTDQSAYYDNIGFYVPDVSTVYIDNAPQVSYTWQSVPSISGKNGILQNLVQIKEEAINDGEPVSEATVLSFDSLGNINIPSIIDEQMPVDPSDVTSVTATYLIPALENGTYEGIKLLVKKGSIPTSEEDADKVVNLDEPTSILRIDSKSVANLDEDSHYYFVVKLVDDIGTEATSDPKDIYTSADEGWSFDYTGAIQTFVAPKTGIYQLETWGAQGGDASDGTLTARGGYGAYAYGEVLLTQGETLYINVGGQNGYGGGGFNSLEIDAFTQFKGTDVSSAIDCGRATGTMFDANNRSEADSSGELLSNKLLYALGEQGVNLTISTQDKTISYPVAESGYYPYSVYLLPIIRNSDAHYIKCVAKRTDSVASLYSNAYFELSAYYVENGELKFGTNIYIQNPTVDEEVEVSLDVSSMSYVDYIGFGVTKDPFVISDIIIDTTPST